MHYSGLWRNSPNSWLPDVLSVQTFKFPKASDPNCYAVDMKGTQTHFQMTAFFDGSTSAFAANQNDLF